MEHIVSHHHDADTTDLLGFWIYILSDCILFAALFATFAVLHNNLYGGVSLKFYADLKSVFIETLALLFSSFTFGLAMIAFYRHKSASVMVWLFSTLILGAYFISIELSEFIHLYHNGVTWHSSAAMSAFFTLVGTHGLHVSIGLLWILVMMWQLYIFGLTPVMKKRLTYLGLFWSFLDIIWILVYTLVYLMGVL